MKAACLAIWCVTLVLGCASRAAAPRMGGFSDEEARAAAQAEPVDPCSFRTGRLVVEVEEALVREYPHYGVAGSRSEEPMLLTVLTPSGTAAPRAAEVAMHLAPAAYRPGDRIVALEGRRLLDKPLRTLRGRKLTIRLAENDRSSAPHWARLGESATAAGGGVISAVGVPVSGGVLTQALELIRKIDRDDLVLLAEVDVDAVTAALTISAGAQRLRFQTKRRTADAGRPVAELALLVYREPEANCR